MTQLNKKSGYLKAKGKRNKIITEKWLNEYLEGGRKLKKLFKQVKEIVQWGLIFTLVVGILFFAAVGLEAWNRGFVW